MTSEEFENNYLTLTSEVAKEVFGDEFKLRTHQPEAIAGVVQSVMSGAKHTLLESPTGSGKSVVAILSAYLLYKLFGMKSYILVSDLSLYAQYEYDFTNKLKLGCFGFLKGKEQYACARNRLNVSQADCSLHNVSATSLMYNYNPEYRCAECCEYIQQYKKAVAAPITLMTYQLYFIQRNYVEESLMDGSNANFPMRDFVICDECHNICQICQSHFEPKIDIQRPNWMDVLNTYSSMPNDELERQLIVKSLLECNDDENEKIVKYACEYSSFLMKYCMQNQQLRSRLAGEKNLSVRDKAALSAGNRAQQEHCKFDDLLKFLEEGFDRVKFITRTISDSQITLNFIYDDVMLQRHFHQKSKQELLMSATIGDFNEFASFAGLDKDSTNVMKTKSTFKFAKSPIYYQTCNKMSYASKHESMKKILAQIECICVEHGNERGIIQTGNYEVSRWLEDNMSEELKGRCLFYSGSAEKQTVLKLFGEMLPNDNRILVGPTLLEGLDFPDDKCRFQICAKIPYTSLSSKYVKKKAELIKGWYQYDATLKTLQGIGRGVRNENDWCVTYILDGCVQNILGGLRADEIVSRRLKNVVNYKCAK